LRSTVTGVRTLAGRDVDGPRMRGTTRH
jgi:hypothetical protein